MDRPALDFIYCPLRGSKAQVGGLTSLAALSATHLWLGSTNGTIRLYDGKTVTVQAS